MQSSCETCEFYIYDDLTDEYICDISLDEDEMADFIYGQTKHCPYYRYYDEYKSVQKQNWLTFLREEKQAKEASVIGLSKFYIFMKRADFPLFFICTLLFREEK